MGLLERKQITWIIIPIILLLGVFSLSTESRASIRKEFNYQGKLTDASSVAVPDGLYDITFNIYTQAGGGTAAWSEGWTAAALFAENAGTITLDGCASGVDKIAYSTGTNELSLAAGQTLWNTIRKQSAVVQSVDAANNFICIYHPAATWTSGEQVTNRIYVKNGLFSVMVGSVTEQVLEFTGTNYYLGVKVGSDAEMVPRKKIGAVPQAWNANSLDGDGYINLDSTNAAADAANIDYNPSSGTYKALSITYGNAGGTGTALSVTQNGTGKLVSVMDGATEAFTILDGGNVGIGTSTPSEKLEVNGKLKIGNNTVSGENVTFDGDTAAGMRVTNSYGYISITPLNSGWAHIYTDRNSFIFNKPVYSVDDIFSSYDANLQLQRNGVTKITAGASAVTVADVLQVSGAGNSYFTGNLGIGTTNPIDKLHLDFGTSNGNLLLQREDTTVDSEIGLMFKTSSDTANAYKKAGIIFKRKESSGNARGDLYIGTDIAADNGNFQASDAQLSIIGSGTTAGNVGIGTASPTAVLHLKAGTAAAGTAPLKFTSGTNLTTAEAGAMEYDGTNLYFTPASSRKTVAFTDSNITGTAANVTGTVAVANGGTGLTSITANGILYGNGTGQVGVTAAGTNNYLLYSNSGTPAWTNAPTISGANITSLNAGNISSGTLSVARGGTGAATLTGVLKGSGTSAITAMTGTANYAARWTDANTLGTGVLYDNGTNVGIGTTSPGAKLEVSSNIGISGSNPNLTLSPAAGTQGRIIGTSGFDYHFFPDMTSGNLYFAYNSNVTNLYFGNGGTVNRPFNLGFYANNNIAFNLGDDGVAPDEMMRITSVGLGIGLTSPTAKLHIKAGTATANTAPLKFTSGTNLTTPEAGAVEYDGTNLYFTPAAARKTVAFTDSNITGTASNVTGTVAVGNGGTGATTLTGIIKGNGTSAMTALTGTANYAARWTDANTLGTGVLYDNGTNVGIGTTSPDQKLSLQDGQIIFQNSSSNLFESGRIRFTEYAGTSYQGSFIHYDGSTNTFNIGVHDTSDETAANDLNAISILRNSGNVGIATTAPQQRLTLGGGDNLAVEMNVPGTPTLTPSTTGGTLAAGTYYYKITAVDGIGETVGSTEASVTTTGTTSSVDISWAGVTGATAYRIYRGTSAGGENTYYVSNSVSLTDTGAAGTAGTPPTVTTAYVNKVTAAGNSWLRGGQRRYRHQCSDLEAFDRGPFRNRYG